MSGNVVGNEYEAGTEAASEIATAIHTLADEVARLRRVLAAGWLLRYGTDKRLAPTSTEAEALTAALLEGEVSHG